MLGMKPGTIDDSDKVTYRRQPIYRPAPPHQNLPAPPLYALDHVEQGRLKSCANGFGFQGF